MVLENAPLNVVEEGRLWKGAKAVIQLGCPQAARFLVVLGVYAGCLAFSFWIAYQFRFDFSVPASERAGFRETIAWIVPVKLAILFLLMQFDGLLSYFSVPDLRRLATSLGAATLFLGGVWLVSEGRLAPPRGVIIADFLISFLLVASIRLVFRLAREKYVLPGREWTEREERVGIIGAGDAGATLARELMLKSHLGLKPVVFFDDDPRKWNCRIHNIPVAGAPEAVTGEGFKLDRVILAMPSATKRRCREIAGFFQMRQIRFEQMPAADQFVTGSVRATQQQEVSASALLGTGRLNLGDESIRRLLRDRVVLVTGAGGRVGAELCRQIARCEPKELVLLEECEVQMFQIQQELIQGGHGSRVAAVVADLLDQRRLERVFHKHAPEIVFHTAVHQQVRLMEEHPGEAIKLNCIATGRLAELSRGLGVKEFVLLTSTLAEGGRSVVGISQRLGEMIVQSAGVAADQSERRFLAVRLDALIGSSDRIVRRFQDEIEVGGPLRIPDPGAVCYPVSLAEAIRLLLECVVIGKNGETFTLAMGKPIKLLELAHKMIELSGLKPDQDIEIEFTGFDGFSQDVAQDCGVGERSGQSEFVESSHGRILKAALGSPRWETLQAMISELQAQVDQVDACSLKQLSRKILSECEALAQSDDGMEPRKNVWS